MAIDTTDLPLAKPKDREGRITLTPAQRKAKLGELCAKQFMRCCTCANRMTREPYRMNTATLDHRQPQPAGCSKDDSDSNLQAMCWKCNFMKGSKRNA